MSKPVDSLLPEWKAQPNGYTNKLLAVFKNGKHVDDIKVSTKKDHMIFGRKKDLCDVLLEHQSISRQHAVLFFGEMGAVYIMDLGSSHGTAIDGKLLSPNSPSLLAPESELIFGQSSRRYKLCSAPKKPPVPVFSGKNAFEVPAVSLPPPSPAVTTADEKEQERQQRQKEIAAMVEEMSNPVPIFESVQVNSSNRADLIKARVQSLADDDGATLEYNDEEGDMDEVDVAALEEVSDSDDEDKEKEHEVEEKGRRQGEREQPVTEKNSSEREKDKGPQSGKVNEETTESSMDAFSLERKIPLSHQIDLRGHNKAVSCLSCEPAGNRIVTGSMDYSVKLYDFGGMDMRHRSFKGVEVQDGYPLAALAHTPSGDKFIACTGSCQPKVYTRDGEEVITFVRGDMYLRDLSHTKGHTMEVTGAQWHPSAKGVLLTSSMDGSLRIWDLAGEANFGNLCNQHVLKIRGKSGQPRVGARCCTYSLDGSMMIGGATDGTIHIWKTKKHYTRADFIIEQANIFSPESAVMSVVPSPCNPHVYASRGEDGTLRLWEINKKVSSMKKPRVLRTFSKVDNLYPTANVAFSPDGSLLCCGTSPPTGSSAGKSMLYFFDLHTKKFSEKVPRVEEGMVAACLGVAVGSEESAIFVQWQAKSNQVFCSTSAGFVRVFFDPRISEKGAVITAGRAPKREKDPSDYSVMGEIYNPHALPMYKQESLQDAKRKKAEQRKDPVVSKIPVKQIAGRGPNANNQSFFFTKYVMEGRTKNTTGMEDPREALLKMDALAADDPIFFGRAYEKNQPVKEMHTETFEEEQEQFKKRQKLV